MVTEEPTTELSHSDINGGLSSQSETLEGSPLAGPVKNEDPWAVKMTLQVSVFAVQER